MCPFPSFQYFFLKWYLHEMHLLGWQAAPSSLAGFRGLIASELSLDHEDLSSNLILVTTDQNFDCQYSKDLDFDKMFYETSRLDTIPYVRTRPCSHRPCVPFRTYWNISYPLELDGMVSSTSYSIRKLE